MEHNQTIGIAETFFPPKLSPISSTAIPQWSWLIWMEISFKIVCSPILELLFHVQNIPNGLTLWSIGASFSGHIYLHRQFRACREVRLLFAWHQDLAKGHPYASQCLSLIRSPTRIMILSCDQIYVLCDDWSKFLYPGTAILREKNISRIFRKLHVYLSRGHVEQQLLLSRFSHHLPHHTKSSRITFS